MMDINTDLGMFFSMFLTNLPKLIVSIIAVAVVMGRREQLGRAATLALLGFGLYVAMCFLIPVVQVVAHHWMRVDGGYSRAGLIYGGLSFVWSALHAVATGLLLMALVATQRQPAVATTMPTLPGQS